MSYMYNNISSSESFPRFYDGMKFNYTTNGSEPKIRPDQINVDGMTNFNQFFKECHWLPNELVGNYQLVYVEDMFNPIYVNTIPFELDLSYAATEFKVKSNTALTGIRFKQNSIKVGVYMQSPLATQCLFSYINALSDSPTSNNIGFHTANKPQVEGQTIKIVDGLAVACIPTDPDNYGTIEDYITNIKHRGAIIYAS